ncbi:peptidoglycan DD-metalloendopeptidase family protein [Photobacterium sanguinicancri]|uniref:peptidoglycan DD-metalloendopeptidase family protein n=1 Tax=Photobacterium sanguinicancri TaxID=875932 RepID=UPI002480F434|nr:peptidoglycan DD-metalloendopeptidase family protein [Photobacterium sanguinicancri]
MIKHLTKTFRASALCTGALLCLCFSQPLYASGDNQLDGVKDELSRQQGQLQDKQKRYAALQNELKKRELTIANATKKIHQAENKRKALTASIAKLSQEQLTLQQQRLGQQEMLRELLNTQYRQGEDSQLANLLSGQDSHTLDRYTVYAERISKARIDALTALSAIDTELQLKKHELALQRQQQQALVNELQAENKKRTGEQTKRKRTLAGIKGQMSNDRSYINELKVNERRLIKEIAKAKLEAERAARQAPMDGLAKHRGKLPWPVKGTVRHNYGTKQQGELRWKGMVIGKASGSKVNAVYPGKVIFADWLRGYGLMLAIDHGKGDMTFYGYNQTLLKKVGDSVQANEAIALVGDSGGQSQSGLYFEIRRKGTPTNPRTWLKK